MPEVTPVMIKKSNQLVLNNEKPIQRKKLSWVIQKKICDSKGNELKDVYYIEFYHADFIPK